MPLKTILMISVALLFSACDNIKTDYSTTGNEQSEVSVNKVCSKDGLLSTSEGFLNSLKNENSELATSFYYPKSLTEDGELITYTFFPKKNPKAIFDFVSKNSESAFVIDPFGAYNNGRAEGQLILFVQEKSKNDVVNEKFLIEKKFDEYFGCFFLCVEGDWKIAQNACFEDSGGPFYPSEDYP